MGLTGLARKHGFARHRAVSTAEPMAPIDLVATLVSDELTRRSDRLLERQAYHFKMNSTLSIALFRFLRED